MRRFVLTLIFGPRGAKSSFYIAGLDTKGLALFRVTRRNLLY